MSEVPVSLPPPISSPVREETCPHDCGLKGTPTPDAVEARVAREQHSVDLAVVRKTTCRHDCGFQGSPDKVFDHEILCLKRQDKITSKANRYLPPEDLRGGGAGGDTMYQMEAKARMTRDARFQKASLLKATGRSSNDEFLT